MKKSIFVLVAFLFPLLSLAQEEAVDPKAKTLLNKAIAVFETKKSISADFVMKIENQRNNKEESFKGTLLLKEDKFKLSVHDVDTYFDGKTQSVMMTKENEVTISTPTQEDLKEINPILLMKSANTDYKMRYLGAVKVNGQMMEKIELYPNDLKSKYSIITLLITQNDYQFNTLTLKGKDGITTQFYVTKMTHLKSLSNEVFVFNAKNYPNVEVVDLR